MFGSNTTIPPTVTVAGIETHVMSTLVGQTGVAAQHKKVSIVRISMRAANSADA